MDIEEFARLEVAAGAEVAFHCGTWWRRIKPFYAWPLHLLESVPRGKSEPPLSYRILGYEHAVSDRAEANSTLPVILLQDPTAYGLGSLQAKKRNQVRRGLERARVCRMVDIKDLADQGVEINRSALSRQHWGGDRSGYLDESRWRRGIERAHALGARESWAAYVDGKLVAYLRSYELRDAVYITQTMSHSEYLGYYVNDALLHSFLVDCSTRHGVTSVVFGLACTKTSLNEYKMKFGFRIGDLPIYRRLNPAVKGLLRFTRYRHYLESGG